MISKQRAKEFHVGVYCANVNSRKLSALNITKKVKDEILEVCFPLPAVHQYKKFVIMNTSGEIVYHGKVAGYVNRTCIHLGNLKKGTYHFLLEEQEEMEFIIV